MFQRSRLQFQRNVAKGNHFRNKRLQNEKLSGKCISRILHRDLTLVSSQEFQRSVSLYFHLNSVCKKLCCHQKGISLLSAVRRCSVQCNSRPAQFKSVFFFSSWFLKIAQDCEYAGIFAQWRERTFWGVLFALSGVSTQADSNLRGCHCTHCTKRPNTNVFFCSGHWPFVLCERV